MDVPGFFTVSINPNVTVTLSDTVARSTPSILEGLKSVPQKPLMSPSLAERARCLAILRALQRECNPNDPEELFGFNRLGRAISRIESGE